MQPASGVEFEDDFMNSQAQPSARVGIIEAARTEDSQSNKGRSTPNRALDNILILDYDLSIEALVDRCHSIHISYPNDRQILCRVIEMILEGLDFRLTLINQDSFEHTLDRINIMCPFKDLTYEQKSEIIKLCFEYSHILADRCDSKLKFNVWVPFWNKLEDIFQLAQDPQMLKIVMELFGSGCVQHWNSVNPTSNYESFTQPFQMLREFCFLAIKLSNNEPGVIDWAEKVYLDALRSAPSQQRGRLIASHVLSSDMSDWSLSTLNYFTQTFANIRFPVDIARKWAAKSFAQYRLHPHKCVAIVWMLIKSFQNMNVKNSGSAIHTIFYLLAQLSDAQRYDFCRQFGTFLIRCMELFAGNDKNGFHSTQKTAWEMEIYDPELWNVRMLNLINVFRHLITLQPDNQRLREGVCNYFNTLIVSEFSNLGFRSIQNLYSALKLVVGNLGTTLAMRLHAIHLCLELTRVHRPTGDSDAIEQWWLEIKRKFVELFSMTPEWTDVYVKCLQITIENHKDEDLDLEEPTEILCEFLVAPKPIEEQEQALLQLKTRILIKLALCTTTSEISLEALECACDVQPQTVRLDQDLQQLIVFLLRTSERDFSEMLYIIDEILIRFICDQELIREILNAAINAALKYNSLNHECAILLLRILMVNHHLTDHAAWLKSAHGLIEKLVFVRFRADRDFIASAIEKLRVPGSEPLITNLQSLLLMLSSQSPRKELIADMKQRLLTAENIHGLFSLFFGELYKLQVKMINRACQDNKDALQSRLIQEVHKNLILAMCDRMTRFIMMENSPISSIQPEFQSDHIRTIELHKLLYAIAKLTYETFLVRSPRSFDQVKTALDKMESISTNLASPRKVAYYTPTAVATPQAAAAPN